MVPLERRLEKVLYGFSYAVTDQTLKINTEKKVISLNLQIDTDICSMYEYFEIFLQRVRECLPPDWGSGWDNIFFNVTCENQRRADERIPILFDLPFKHKGIMCAPFIGPVSIRQYLSAGQIEQVICGGENYDGARPCNFDWVKSLRQECVDANVTFCFIEIGTVFIKDGRRYHLPSKQLQSRMAYKSGMNFQGRPIHFDLVDDWGYPIPQEDLYVPHFRTNCETCGSKLICNGCSDCGKCL